jgi:cytochrome b
LSRIAVWDRPIRVFHWLIVLLVPASWATAKWHYMDVHMLLGQLMLGLVLFRIFWGLIGSSTARFAGFVRGPGAVLGYLRGRAAAGPGHNPLGALSVLVLLTLLAVQVGLGLFASDEDGLYQGPLARHVSDAASETLGERHHTMFYVLLAFILLHVAAILFYLIVRRQNLVTPMVTGKRDAAIGEAAMTPAPALRFILAAAAAAGLTILIADLL